MTDLLHQALRAGHASIRPATPPAPASTLVLGGAGPLGAAVLEALIAHRGAGTVYVATIDALNVGLRGLHELRLAGGPEAWPSAPAARAVVVFDQARYSNGREEAFWVPDPRHLVAVGRWLRGSGVNTLVLVMPHAPASLPDALKQGLANLDEEALAMLGFEHLVFVRSAQRPRSAAEGHRLQRLAHWMLSQLQLMVPARERPVRPVRVAALVRGILAQLPAARPGTRVMRPELVWQSAQLDEVDHLVRRLLVPEGEPTTGAPTGTSGATAA